LRTGVATVIEAPTLYGCSQYFLPVSGSSDATAPGYQMISCRAPPAVMMIGCATPSSVSDDSARQISFPVSLSNATTFASSLPPTRQISRLPSTSGALENPQSNAHVLRSAP